MEKKYPYDTEHLLYIKGKKIQCSALMYYDLFNQRIILSFNYRTFAYKICFSLNSKKYADINLQFQQHKIKHMPSCAHHIISAPRNTFLHYDYFYDQKSGNRCP